MLLYFLLTGYRGMFKMLSKSVRGSSGNHQLLVDPTPEWRRAHRKISPPEKLSSDSFVCMYAASQIAWEKRMIRCPLSGGFSSSDEIVASHPQLCLLPFGDC